MNRVGVGFDVHRLVAGRALILGGVHIPFERGLDGDSDADVLTHAIIDALLGATALGDIGARFGVGRPENMGISSLILLEKVVALIREQGYRPYNVDATVVAEAPRIGAERLARESQSREGARITATTNWQRHRDLMSRLYRKALLSAIAADIGELARTAKRPHLE